MNNSTKWFLGLFVGVVILVFSVWYIYVIFLPSRKTPDLGINVNPKPTPAFTKTDLPENSLPDDMPRNLPFEEGAVVLQNYSVTTTDSRKQSTRSYLSKKSLAQNYKIYSDYLKANQWKVVASLDQPKLKILSATQAGIDLKIDITEDSETAKVQVTVSLIQAQVNK